LIAPGLEHRFLRLTLINILANLTVPLSGLIDTAMLGHLTDIRFLAGVALASVLFDYIYWSLGFLRMGTTGTTAQAVGREDTEEIPLTLYRATILAAAAAAVVLAMQVPFREAGFAMLGGTPAVEQAGREYFNARIWGAPATLINFALIGWFLGREQSRRVLVMTVWANLANIGFNYLFIIRLGWAARGAGLATMLAQHVMLLCGLVMFLRDRPVARVDREQLLRRGSFAGLIKLNGEILVRTLCLVSAFAVFTNLSSVLGTTVLAANSILLRLFTASAYLIDGAAFACESLAGIFRGRRELASLRRLFTVAHVTGLAFAALVLSALFAAPRAVLGGLTSHDEIVSLAARYAAWLIPVLLLGAPAFMYDGLFIGLTEGRHLRNWMLVSVLLVFTPLAAWAWRAGDNHLLWGALAAFMAARTLTLAIASRGVLADYRRSWAVARPGYSGVNK
jgi:MATE family multidrug resistance protein